MAARKPKSCAGQTARGTACKSRPVSGERFCKRHLEQSKSERGPGRPEAPSEAPSILGAPERVRCVELTLKGAPCKSFAAAGSDRCRIHLGDHPRRKRPVEFDEAIADEIVKSVRVVGYVRTAAIAAGISMETLTSWLERGDPAGAEQADEPCRHFRREFEKALAQTEVLAASALQRAAQRDWRAAAFLLERQFPERWGGPLARNRAAVGGPGEELPASLDPLAPTVLDDQVGPDGQPL